MLPAGPNKNETWETQLVVVGSCSHLLSDFLIYLSDQFVETIPGGRGQESRDLNHRASQTRGGINKCVRKRA